MGPTAQVFGLFPHWRLDSESSLATLTRMPASPLRPHRTPSLPWNPRAWGFLACLVARVAFGATDWPQFRGPTGDGHSPAKDVPLSWNATRNIAWKVPVPGQGWSSPVLDHDTIFLTAAAEGGGGLRLLALAFEARTGKPLWKTEVFAPHEGFSQLHRKNSQASPTPLVAGDRVFVHFGHLGTACLSREGKILWQQNALRYNPVHGNGGSPILVEDKLVFTADGAEDPALVALDKDTGKLAWRTDRKAGHPKNFSFATPSLIRVDGQAQIIAPASGIIAAYRPQDGTEIWRVRHEGFSVIPKPVFAHGLVFAGTGYEAPTAIAIEPKGTGDITEASLKWTLRKGAPNTPSFLVVGEELYLLADNGVLSCVDPRTGKVHYQERACGQSSASPVFAEGRIYLLDEQGLGVVIAPGKEFKKLAENPLGERTLASYAVTDGALFVRSETSLYRISIGGTTTASTSSASARP